MNAWLIEKRDMCLGYCGASFSWVPFTYEDAIRFSRKQDAENMLKGLRTQHRLERWLDGAEATEHAWPDPVPTYRCTLCKDTGVVEITIKVYSYVFNEYRQCQCRVKKP